MQSNNEQYLYVCYPNYIKIHQYTLTSYSFDSYICQLVSPL